MISTEDNTVFLPGDCVRAGETFVGKVIVVTKQKIEVQLCDASLVYDEKTASCRMHYNFAMPIKHVPLLTGTKNLHFSFNRLTGHYEGVVARRVLTLRHYKS
jgi:hypothetical protein